MPTLVIGLPNGERVRVDAARTERDAKGRLELYDADDHPAGDFPAGSYAVPADALDE